MIPFDIKSLWLHPDCTDEIEGDTVNHIGYGIRAAGDGKALIAINNDLGICPSAILFSAVFASSKPRPAPSITVADAHR